MDAKKKFSVVVSILLFLTACGGGGATESAADDPNEEELTSVAETRAPLIFDVEEPSVTSAPEPENLFGGFSEASESSSSLGEANVEEASSTTADIETATSSDSTVLAKPILQFQIPTVDCKDTRTDIGNTQQYVETLYRNCLFRPIVATNDQTWVKQLNEAGSDVSREKVRSGIYNSAEAQCLRGVAKYADRCPDSKVFAGSQGYEIECKADGNVAAPTSRIKERLDAVCGGTIVAK